MYKHGNKFSFQLYLDKELREDVERLSKIKKISMNDIIRESIVEKVNKEIGDGRDNKNRE